ncbi:tRNA lysidine(34) synthetase TilS [Mycoplasmatota bacterium WC30]
MLEKFDLNLIKENDMLLLAVSGGIDSMVLLHYLHDFSTAKKFGLAVVHLDHQKRKESVLDCQLVVDTCAKLSIECYTEKLVSQDSENFHDYARTKRYDFFVKIAKNIGANKIVLAHNSNDNAETVLMRLTRGSSFEGYRGILAETNYDGITIIRPMLSVSRTEILAYQKANNIVFNEDSSNQEDHYTRNRYRHHVLPFLETENPKYLEKFEQFSNYQTKAYKLIEKLAYKFLADNLIKYKDSLAVDVVAFNEIDDIIKIDVIKKLVNQKTRNSVELTYQNIQDIEELFVNDKPHIEMFLNDNLYIYKSYNMMYFSDRKSETVDFEYTIEECQEIKLPNNSLVIITDNPNKYYGNIYKLCYNNLDFIFPITIRNRRNGDKISTTSGTKKIKDVFINKKISMDTRNQLPIVLNSANEIIWVPNVFKAQTYGKNILYVIYQEGK